MAWLSGYTYRKKKPVNSTTAGAQTNYQMELLVGESSGASGEEIDCESHCQDFPDDIRFTKEDGTTKHDYWVQSITGTTPNRLATIKIEIASIPASGDVDFYMYYGKSSDDGESNGINTFTFFDDFEAGGCPIEGVFGSWQRNRASYIVGNYAYVTSQTQLHIVNISDKKNPSVLSNLTLGAQMLDINVNGNYAYISDKSGNALYCVNISDPEIPYEEDHVADATKLKANHGIFYLSGYVYCCAYSDGTTGSFTIIDVSTPSNITIRGHITDADKLKGIHDVYVEGNYAYVACHFSGTANQGRITIINISDKDNPSIVGSISSANLLGAADIQKSGNYVYTGNSNSTPANRWIRSIDVSDVENPSIADSLTGYGSYVCAIYGTYLYTVDNYGCFNKVDISTPTSLSLTKHVALLPSTVPNSHIFLTSDGAYFITLTHYTSSNGRYYIVKMSTLLDYEELWTIESGGGFRHTCDPVKYGLCAAEQFDGGGPGAQESYHSFTNQTSDFIIEMWGRIHGASGKYRYIMIESTGGDHTNGVKLQWFGNTKLYYQSDSGNQEIMNVSMDTWYKLKMLIHPSSDTFDLWVDDVSKVTGGDVTGTIVGGCSALSLFGYLTNEVYPQFIDTVFLRKYATPEPTWGASGNEESTSEEGQPTMARWHGIPGMNYTGRRGGW